MTVCGVGIGGVGWRVVVLPLYFSAILISEWGGGGGQVIEC